MRQLSGNLDELYKAAGIANKELEQTTRKFARETMGLHVYKMMTAISTEENIELYKKDKNKLLQLEEDQDGFFDPVNL